MGRFLWKNGEKIEKNQVVPQSQHFLIAKILNEKEQNFWVDLAKQQPLDWISSDDNHQTKTQ